ncbi:MAG: hypothetical protein MMC33_001809 [Icmadophila ericetorum]|nr:hypothetical protein [Icmadophila ericetorum]
MPGRQSTGPRVQKLPKAKTQKKRALNALAIAEQQNPAHFKIRRNRLGQVDDSNQKRKRPTSEESSEDEEGDQSSSKRLRKRKKDKFGQDIEHGSDSEGNEWVVGDVASDESDLDSDEAMGESDEERFQGFTFRGSSVSKVGSKQPTGNALPTILKPTETNLNEEDNEIEGEELGLDDESDDFRERAVDLADMLDASDSKESEDAAGRRGGNPESMSDHTDIGSEKPSDDHRSLLSMSDLDSDDEHNASKLSAIQTLVSSLQGHETAHGSRHRPIHDPQEAATPTEYGLTAKQKLTIADLLPTINDPRLKKSLKILTDDKTKRKIKSGGIPQKLEVPLAKRQQDRLDRAAAYEKSKETLNRWIETVKGNRRAKHLSFPLQAPDELAAKGTTRLLPTTSSKPLTTLESTIQNILEISGLAPIGGNSEEAKLQAFEELQSNKLPIEEVQARRAELRKARDLLFREEIRAKRIKKIKSKSYRRVHRREREHIAEKQHEALVAAGEESSGEERERNDRRRAIERMGARHRESKWAKGVKDSGRAAWDEDARSGVTEMVKRGEQLRKRIEGKDDSDDSDSTGSDLDDVDDLMEPEDVDQLNRASNVSLSGLATMKFMQKAEARHKAQNDADLAQLRREVGGESTDEDEMFELPGRREYQPKKDLLFPNAPSGLKQQQSEFEEKLASDEDDEHVSDGFISTNGDLEIMVDNAPYKKRVVPSKHISRPAQKADIAKVLEREDVSIITENPWLSGGTKGRNKRNSKAQEFEKAIISNTPALKPVSIAKPILKPSQPFLPNPSLADDDDASSFSGFSSDEEANPHAAPLNNLDLIREAFAGDEVTADFDTEKNDLIAEEDEKTIDVTLPGWGSWVGEGLSKRSQARNRNRVFEKQPGISADKRTDRNLEKVIISQKRVPKNGKYLASQLPHPFETKAQYERSLRLPVGPEWSTKEVFQKATKPRLLMKQGIITPMAEPLR